ncbi:MAG: DUF1925 domain-containing protein, partial [Candidatus Omnitrophica bacterium]|nr:DUF1925 domain-containing protein [Candidatus Omnitrophota bacterium]
NGGERKGNLRVMADDGEKFGVWPGTYELVYNQGWLDEFFTLIEKHRDVLETVTFSQYVDMFPPLGKIYLPTASYSEMEEWALPIETAEEFIALEKMINTTQEFAQTVKPFVKGGFWRNFLSKYSESNNLYQKMLWVSKQIERCQSKEAGSNSPPPAWLEQARDELWMGQCNDAYSAIKVAGALSKTFSCGLNDLPLSLILSWYEQKAVCILITLLSLGVKNIKLGPTLPAFVSPGVLKILSEKFGLKAISSPEEDLADSFAGE